VKAASLPRLALTAGVVALALAASLTLVLRMKAAGAGHYTTEGRRILDPDGQPFLIHGVNRPSLEWNPDGENLSADDVKNMAAWGANAVRIPTNQDFLLADSCHASPTYLEHLDTIVGWVNEAGMIAILDLHWSDANNRCVKRPGQQPMPDERSKQYWRTLATHYRDNSRVFFDLFNEPHDVDWPCWRNGCQIDQWRAVGMQELYDTVRGAGFVNPVMVEGLDWGRDIAGVTPWKLDGTNVIYSVHPWYPDTAVSRVDASIGKVLNELPVVVGEFGTVTPDYSTSACRPQQMRDLIDYFDAPGGDRTRAIGWIGWAWYAGGGACDQLVSDWAGTPTAIGVPVKEALGGYRAGS
jgi:aryl-phospho-beta-D-glucosidase BglC (GH1 family)